MQYSETDRKTETQKDRYIPRKIVIQTNEQTGKQMFRLTDRQVVQEGKTGIIVLSL